MGFACLGGRCHGWRMDALRKGRGLREHYHSWPMDAHGRYRCERGTDFGLGNGEVWMDDLGFGPLTLWRTDEAWVG